MNTPVTSYCAKLLERQSKRNTLHLNFGSAIKSPTEKGGSRQTSAAR